MSTPTRGPEERAPEEPHRGGSPERRDRPPIRRPYSRRVERIVRALLGVGFGAAGGWVLAVGTGPATGREWAMGGVFALLGIVLLVTAWTI